MEPPPGRYADEYGPDGMPVNCWTMVRKLAVSVLSMVVGVLREALDRLRTGLLTRPSTPGCWPAAPLAGPSTVALDVIDTTIESDTHPDAAANGDGGGIRCGQPPSCAHSAWPGVSSLVSGVGVNSRPKVKSWPSDIDVFNLPRGLLETKLWVRGSIVSTAK
ncbi:hypothetical protein BHM03_00060682 [Ensete ventricosum]|nr:hypothetical protein BHM03_00060682 [Ensete ventricosum]